ncbi:MAG: hypothetical protein MK086_01180 [Flavobacteriales bacterium]|nr:hypothetical protein [Flavobacteriales bacterium]
MNAFRFRYNFIFLLIVAAVSCNEKDDLPDEPVINSIDFDEDQKLLIFNFTDGDGNFGLSESMTNPPFQDSIDGGINEFSNNLWLDLFVKEEGSYNLVETSNPNGFDFRIPELTPQGQNKQLRVTGTYDLAFDLEALTEGNNPELSIGDTLKFEVILVDRDLNLSNLATTENHILQ